MARLAPRPRGDNRYSRLVAYLKIALPLAALGLLSTLFLFPQGPGGDATAPLGPEELEELMRRRLLRAPSYSAVTENGAVTVTAESATPRPDDDRFYEVTRLAATVEREDGRRTTLAARDGTIDREEQAGTFTGDVRIVTAEGAVLETERLRAALDGSYAESPARVRVTTATLDLRAGAMEASTQPGGVPAGRVLFTGGVRLIYTPPTEEGSP
ncbi:MAG: LPS export ABC transporter periplasmic protein LptC [Deinococcus-Thermus bacterium]|jgi:lipopolysaccharide export system protein LptC|nr:LPS export ABC transporter periplasmic protein LptC [Deinococcota bacterium]